MFQAVASQLSTKMIGRMALHRGSPLLTKRVVPSSNFQTPTRRPLHNWGSPIPEPEFSPGENILLDVTAWFVAVALVYSPSNEFESWDEVRHREPDPSRKNNGLRAEKKRATERQDENNAETSSDHHKGH